MYLNLLKKSLTNIAGKNAAEIIELLFGKKNINEFIIAKKLKLTINQTRHILYKLSDAGLVSFTRKKDKRKGWYTYFWTLDIEKSLFFLRGDLKKEIELLQKQLTSRETKRFYHCKTCGIETTEENALLHEFTCPECGEVYELQKSEKIVSEFKNRISRLVEQLKDVEKEINEIQLKKQKKFEREKKKLAREKAAKRKKTVEKRRADKKKLKKKEEKKTPKKKSKGKPSKTKATKKVKKKTPPKKSKKKPKKISKKRR